MDIRDLVLKETQRSSVCITKSRFFIAWCVQSKSIVSFVSR